MLQQTDYFKSDEDLLDYVLGVTGYEYVFATSSVRRWYNQMEDGIFYQLMPLNDDDGFFDWYVEKSPNQQFFKNKFESVMRIVKFWIQWKLSQNADA